MPEEIIEVRNLSKRFGSFQAVHDVSFSVFKGDVFGFLGPNGAGKSTSIRCLNSLIKPDSGTVELFGESIATHRESILGRVGSIIEKPDFYKYLSAYRNLEIFSRISGKPSSKREIYNMLDFVGLGGREKDKFAGFSHGMKQRLGIAQTLLHNPDLIILDEPTTGLDPQGIRQIRDIIRIIASQGTTILLASHLLDEVEKVCSHVVVLQKGVMLYQGSVHNMIENNSFFELKSNDSQQLKLVLQNHPSVEKIIDEEEKVLVFLKQDIAAQELNSYLFENKIVLEHLVKRKNSLEEQFLKLTN